MRDDAVLSEFMHVCEIMSFDGEAEKGETKLENVISLCYFYFLS